MNFVAHKLLPVLDDDGDVAVATRPGLCPAPGPGAKAMKAGALIGVSGLNSQRIQRKRVVVLRVRRRRMNDLLDFARHRHRQVAQNCHRLINTPALYRLKDESDFPRRDPHVLAFGAHFHVLDPYRLAPAAALTCVVRSERPPAWPRKVRVGGNWPSRGPPMSRVMQWGPWRGPW